MALTKGFKETVKTRVQRDTAFRRELLREGVECLLAGDLQTGKAVLRNYINATVGFVALAEVVGRSPKSLMRMFGPSGNPQARNLFQVVRYLQQKEHVSFHLKVQSAA